MSSIFQTLRKPYDYALSLYPSKTHQGVSPSQSAEKTSVLSSILSPFETYVVSLQSLLIWEKPYLSAGAFVTLNILYWLIVSWNRRFLSIVSIFALALFLYKTWVNQIWPEIRVPPKEGEDTESWCTLNPGVLSVPELCKYLNDFLDKMIILWKDVWKLRKENHGLFCSLMCGFFSLTGLIGLIFPGVLIIYFFVLLLTLGPGVALHLIPSTVYDQIIGYFSETDSQVSPASKSPCISDKDSDLEEFVPEISPEVIRQLSLKDDVPEIPSPGVVLTEGSELAGDASFITEIAKCAASRSVLSDSGSCRTTTPSSEITSSDEACSSCRDDMLVGNKHLLADKLHQEGKRILNLIESCGLTSGAEKEAIAWLEERAYIVGKLRLINEDSDVNSTVLKVLIDNLCEEVLRARELITNHNQEISMLRTKCVDLQNIITDNNTKICILANSLSHQKNLNAELEARLTTCADEIYELGRTIDESNRLTPVESTGSHTQQRFINSSSSSYDVGKLRSADTPKSVEKFSVFLPEIGNSPPVKLNKTEEMYPESVKSLLELTNEIRNSPEDIEPPESRISTQRSSIHQQLIDNLNEEGIKSSYEAKIHKLYWVYRKCLSLNKSLIYQKRYLLMLLRGYLMTEKFTLSFANQIDKSISCDKDSHRSSTSARGRVLFKSAAYVVIAIQRMKYFVHKWRLLAKVPASYTVKKEVHSAFQRSSSPIRTPSGINMSYLSLSSRSPSVCEDEKVHTSFNSSASSTSLRSGTKSKRRSKPSKAELIQYVHRLDELQKQLGLDNLS